MWINLRLEPTKVLSGRRFVPIDEWQTLGSLRGLKPTLRSPLRLSQMKMNAKTLLLRGLQSSGTKKWHGQLKIVVCDECNLSPADLTLKEFSLFLWLVGKLSGGLDRISRFS